MMVAQGDPYAEHRGPSTPRHRVTAISLETWDKSSLTIDDTYHGGWGLRREGNGEKPVTVPGKEAPTDPATLKKLEMQSSFAKGEGRYALSPTCDGYPDVDTYRDLEFYLIAHGN